ncbi:DUF3781 domain-containing protein [Flavobacterium procerum]|uniref:DUF3781 domain-containing protein n=1 Tax=Flavobacterium procerum TaxID=1455569 RepID=A0ABV6BVQ8_9FLAO
MNKKLNLQLLNSEIEELILNIISETDFTAFEKTGKNFYISNYERNTRLTINSFTYRIITADKLNKIKERK